MEGSEGRFEYTPNEAGQEAEPRFPVNLRPSVLGYFAEGLRPAYQRELDEARRDGSYKGIQDFHSSEIASLMGRMMDQYTEPDRLPEKVNIMLSEGDLRLLDEKINAPGEAGGSLLHREMKRELRDSYERAKPSRTLVKFKRIMGRFRGKK